MGSAVTAEISYASAIALAISECMEQDSSVFCYGIGVPDHLGIFGTTLGLGERFGEDRALDTPISEDSLLGFGLGAALLGLRPVNVHIRVDFLMLCMNQLVNNVSSYQFGNQGQSSVPLTIRAVIGRGWGQGYQHSKSLHSMFAHIPGLEVYAPATVAEAYHLTKAAIQSNNPSVILEHRWLYWQEGLISASADITKGYSLLSEGQDALVVTTSWMAAEALMAATELKNQGVEITVVNINTLDKPLPTDVLTIANSIGRVIVADNDWVFSGYGAELASQLYEACFHSLRSPILRLGFAATPTPTPRHMEEDFYPNANDIITSIGRLLNREVEMINVGRLFSHENKFRGPF